MQTGVDLIYSTALSFGEMGSVQMDYFIAQDNETPITEDLVGVSSVFTRYLVGSDFFDKYGKLSLLKSAVIETGAISFFVKSKTALEVTVGLKEEGEILTKTYTIFQSGFVGYISPNCNCEKCKRHKLTEFYFPSETPKSVNSNLYGEQIESVKRVQLFKAEIENDRLKNDLHQFLVFSN